MDRVKVILDNNTLDVNWYVSYHTHTADCVSSTGEIKSDGSIFLGVSSMM